MIREKSHGNSLFVSFFKRYIKKIVLNLIKMRSMKKVLVTLLIAFASVSGSMAMELNEYKVFYKLNNEVTFKSLNRYLKLEEGWIRHLRLSVRKLNVENSL